MEFLPKKIETENGEEPYRDLLKNRVDIIQKNRKILLDNREKKMRTKNFKESVRTIPNVLYNPHTALQLMKSTEGGNLFSNAIKYNTENSSVIFYDTVIDDYENENSNNNEDDNNEYIVKATNNFKLVLTEGTKCDDKIDDVIKKWNDSIPEKDGAGEILCTVGTILLKALS